MRRTASSALALGVVLCLIGGVSIARLRDDGASAGFWVTTSDGGLRMSRQRDLPLQAARPSVTIRVLAGQRHQAMLGFGASLTESAAQLIMRLPTAVRRRLLDDLFSPTRGIALTYVRVPIGSSDYVASLPFAAFDLARDERAVLPVLRAASAEIPEFGSWERRGAHPLP